MVVTGMTEADSFRDTQAEIQDTAPFEWQAAYFDVTSDAILALDVETGQVVGGNTAFYQLFGTSEAALRGVHFSALLPPATTNPNTPVGRRFPLTGSVAEGQVFRHTDGSDVVCDVLVTAVRRPPMELAVLHLRDARPREAQLQRRLEADRAEHAETVVRAIEQYMAHVSHEFRTPLAVILSSSSMLERYYARLNESRREEHFTRIQMQVKYLTDFLDNLRFLSRLNANQIAPRPDLTDVRGLLQEMVNEFAGYHPPPRIETTFAGALDSVMLDGGLWRRALLPVIQNAVKYGPQDGVVRISLRRTDTTLETIVSDSGPGLPVEYLSQPFEVFRRGENARETHGGGLGLAIASRCATLLGGTLTFETHSGVGTSFTLIVPVE